MGDSEKERNEKDWEGKKEANGRRGEGQGSKRNGIEESV